MASTPARATRSAAVSPDAELLGEVHRRHPDRRRRRRPAERVEGREDVARRDRRRPGVTSRTPGRAAQTVQRRDALAAALDERRTAGQEERHVRAELRGDRAGGRRRRARRPTPRAPPSSAAAASEDPPARPAATGIRFSSRAASAGAGPGPPGPAAADRRRARPRAPGTRGCRAGGPASSPLDVEACRAWPPAGARLSRSARASGTKTEWRSWKPSGRRPTTASVRLSLAGASRTTGVRRRDGSTAAVTRAASSRRPAGRPDRAERLAQGQPLPHREGLRAPVRVDAGRVERRRHPAGIERELAGQDVVEHLAALAEARLDQPPQLVLGVGIEPVVGVERLDDDDRRFDRRRRLEGRPGGTRERDPDPGVVLHEDRQVAHLPGRRGDPLGDLALDHQDEPLRPRRRAEQRVQDRAGDVVRQVGDHVVGRLDEPRRGPGRARRPRSGAAAPRLERPVEPVAQERGQPAVELDRGHRRPGREQAAGQEPEARPDLEDAAPGPGAASARIASSTSGSARKFCDSAWRARRPGGPQRGPDVGRVEARRGPARSPVRVSRRERQRRPRVQVEPGPLARREPPRARRPDHRAVVRAQRRVAAR